MRAAPLFGLALCVGGCSEGSPSDEVSIAQDGVVSPAEVGANINRWNGHIVTVEGWLGRCEGLDCLLYTNPSDREVLEQDGEWSSKQERALRRTLSIGASHSFDAAAFPLQFSQVRIRGRVNDMCWPARCSDRAPDIEPLSIQSVENN